MFYIIFKVPKFQICSQRQKKEKKLKGIKNIYFL